MILEIKVFPWQVDNIKMLAEALNWKEISSTYGQAPQFPLGIKDGTILILTYEIESKLDHLKRAELTILQSNYMLKW